MGSPINCGIRCNLVKSGNFRKAQADLADGPDLCTRNTGRGRKTAPDK